MKITSDATQQDRKGNRSGNSQSEPSDGLAAQGIDRSQLDEMISVAAYFRAEQRGFAPGDELDDWFRAEAEYLYQADTTGTAS